MVFHAIALSTLISISSLVIYYNKNIIIYIKTLIICQMFYFCIFKQVQNDLLIVIIVIIIIIIILSV